MPARRKEKEDYLIKSVAHALDVMEAFTDKQQEIGVTELSAKLKLHKNNVFRLLATLETRGYVEQNKATENYRLGVKALQLGQTYLQQVGFLKQARPLLERINEETNETVYVGIIRGSEVVYLDCVPSNQRVIVVSRVGSRIPVYCSAIGKAQIAFESVDEVRKKLPEKLTGYTTHTITNVNKLLDHLKEIADRGYSIDEEEYEEGVRCVGVPIRDYSKRVLGGLSLSGPAYRFSDERIKKELAPRLVKIGQELSQRLGFGI